MRWRRKALVLWGLAAFLLAPAAAAKTPAAHRQLSAKPPRAYLRSLGHGGSGIAYPQRAHWAPRGQGRGFAALVGDPGSGLGFYALPLKYRIGAWRYRLTHRRPWRDNPVLFAIAADAARYNYWIPGNRDYIYGVFNPYDGVGTPFSGGYYSSSRDDDTSSDFDGWP
ncbi:MAG: hypothetical protein L0Y57_11370 [Beijerinckiaceae bacterium]|nr:hypothetical protein [Beijerinckiaceae bacterium]